VFSVSLPTRLFHACISSTELLFVNYLSFNINFVLYFQKNVDLEMLVLQEHVLLPFWRRSFSTRDQILHYAFNQIGAFLVSPIFERPRFNPRQRIESLLVLLISMRKNFV